MKVTKYDVMHAVGKLKQKLGARDDLDVWQDNDDSIELRVRLPAGYTLESTIPCRRIDLDNIGLVEQFCTNNGTQFYFFVKQKPVSQQCLSQDCDVNTKKNGLRVCLLSPFQFRQMICKGKIPPTLPPP